MGLHEETADTDCDCSARQHGYKFTLPTATAALTSQTLAQRQANPSLTRSQALQQAMRIIRTGRMPDGARLPGWSPRWANPARWAGFTIITNQDQ